MDIVELFKTEGQISEDLKSKIVIMWDQIVKEASANQIDIEWDIFLSNKQILSFISGTLPIFTHKYAIKSLHLSKFKDDSTLFGKKFSIVLCNI